LVHPVSSVLHSAATASSFMHVPALDFMSIKRVPLYIQMTTTV